MIKLNAKQLRSHQSSDISHQSIEDRHGIYIVLDNVLDTYNIGSAFRLADAVAAKKLYLCGGSETPPNPRIKKASINTTEVVEWEYCANAIEAINRIKNQESRIKVVAVEQNEQSVPYDQYDYKTPICIVVGHETEGVSQEVLDLVDATVEMPMFGINISLNVVVSLGIVLYKILESNKNDL